MAEPAKKPEPSLEEQIMVALHQLPVSIVGNSRRDDPLPKKLAGLAERMHRFCPIFLEPAVGRFSPKTAGFLELRNAVAGCRHKLEKVSSAHRQVLWNKMTTLDREVTDKLRDVGGLLSLDLLLGLVEYALQSLCDNPKSRTRKGAERHLRRIMVTLIEEVFEDAGRYQFSHKELATVCRALAPFFPPEAGLARIQWATVRNIRIREERMRDLVQAVEQERARGGIKLPNEKLLRSAIRVTKSPSC